MSLPHLGDSEKCWVISAVEDAAWRRSWISYDNAVTVIELVIIAQSPSPFPRAWVGNCWRRARRHYRGVIPG